MNNLPGTFDISLSCSTTDLCYTNKEIYLCEKHPASLLHSIFLLCKVDSLNQNIKQLYVLCSIYSYLIINTFVLL